MDFEDQKCNRSGFLDPGTVVSELYKIVELKEKNEKTLVYSAVNLLNEQILSLRILRKEHVNESSIVESLRKEAVLLSSTYHTNLLRVYDFGVLQESAQPYQVVEYLEGERLSSWLAERGPLPFEDALSVFAQVCDGISAAHKAGILHTSLSASCVFLASNKGASILAKISDIANGIFASEKAPSLDLDLIDDESPCYLSPEQLQGAMPSKQSDVYGMACLMYEMLFAEAPFIGRQVKESAIKFSKLQAPPWAGAGHSAWPGIFANVVLKGMQKYPAQRFAEILDLKEAVFLSLGAESANNIDELLKESGKNFGSAH